MRPGRPAQLVVLKSPAEVAIMRRAGRVAAAALRAAVQAVRPGVSTAELDRVAEAVIRQAGAVPSFKGYRGFPAAICVSLDDEVVHGIPGPRIIEEGALVSIDIGVFLDGFHVDTATTVAAGVVPPEVARLLAVTRAALDAGIAAARPGARVGDVAWAIQSVVEAAGFSPVRDLAGHGVGRSLHEDPQVPNVGRPGTGLALQVGMTLAIEPMVNMGGPDVTTDADGWTIRTRDHMLSAHMEHTVAIGAQGPEVLTVPDGAVRSAGRPGGGRTPGTAAPGGGPRRSWTEGHL